MCLDLGKCVYIVRTKDISHSRIHKIWKEKCTDLKFAGMIEELMVALQPLRVSSLRIYRP